MLKSMILVSLLTLAGCAYPYTGYEPCCAVYPYPYYGYGYYGGVLIHPGFHPGFHGSFHPGFHR